MKLRIILSVLTTASIAAAPRMTIVIVIDQLSAHYLPKLKPYLTGGLGFLYREGTNYTNAFYDHCPPCTAAGHAMLATGTYGSVHGIICNRWFNEKGEVIESDSDTAQNAAMFSPTGLYPFGKSARNMLVDTLSDQFMLHSYTHAKNTVWSISHKGRSAIAMAGRLGKALGSTLKHRVLPQVRLTLTNFLIGSAALIESIRQRSIPGKQSIKIQVQLMTSLGQTTLPIAAFPHHSIA